VSAANLADGFYVAAGPLLAARLTPDPLLVAGVVVVQRFSVVAAVLAAGVLVDRSDRRRILLLGNVVRAVAFVPVVVAVVLGLDGAAGLAVLYLAAAVLGIAEALVDTAAVALAPDVVGADRLDEANGRVEAVASVGNELVGPPTGAALFAVAAWAPFVGAAAAFAIAGTAAHRIRGRFTALEDGSPAFDGRGAWREMTEGLSWFWRHRLLRTAAVGGAVANVFATGAISVLVLLVTRDLGYGETVFGLVLLGLAAGSLTAGWTVGRISARIGPGAVILVGNLAVAAGFAVIATTGTAVGVAAALFTVSLAATATNVIIVTVRQTVVPRHLLGRLIASYRLVALMGMPVGAVLGGLLARVDLRAPYVAAAVGFVVLAAVLGVALRSSRIRAARAAVEAPLDLPRPTRPAADPAIPIGGPLA
jgi:MFS family permease